MENTKKIILIISALFIFLSCFSKKGKKQDFSIKENSQKYFQIKDILHRDENNNLFFKTTSYSGASEDIKPKDMYLDEIEFNSKTVKLKNILDTATLKRLNYIYYKDNKHVFLENHMAYGSSFSIVENADIKTFESFDESYYAKDYKNCYYKGNIIYNADSKSFKILQQKDGNDNTSYAKDNKHYFNEANIVPFDKVKDFVTE